MHINTECPFCNKAIEMNVDDEGYSKWVSDTEVQCAFPEMNPFDREVLISGICYDCQEKTFNRPAPGHESAWGKELGECGCCGAPLWEKNIRDNKVVCPSCYTTYNLGPDNTLGEECEE